MSERRTGFIFGGCFVAFLLAASLMLDGPAPRAVPGNIAFAAWTGVVMCVLAAIACLVKGTDS